MDKKKFLIFEVLGTLFAFITGTLLHFSYKWSDGAVWAILFGAVNESIWEHIKIFSMPYILWAILELCIIKMPIKRFIVAKTISLYVLVQITIVFFYAYSSIIGSSVLAIDIISIFVWIALAHLISYKLMMSKIKIENWFTPAAFALAIFLCMYLSFTVNPPRFELFRDPTTNLYGIPLIF